MTEDQLGTLALAAMARVLGRPLPLYRLLELAAEEACDALRAASVSLSEVDVEAETCQTIINVGILGPGEERWPAQETYSTRDFPKLLQLMSDLQPWTQSLADPECDPVEAQLMRDLGKGSAMGVPILVDGQLWGELYATRLEGRPPFTPTDVAYVEVLLAILGGAMSRALREERLVG